MLDNPKFAPYLYASYSGIVLYFAPIQWQGFHSFAYSTPLIILLASWIAYYINTNVAKDLAAFVYLLPVVGFIAWKRQILQLDLAYYPKADAVLDVFWTTRIIAVDSCMMFLSIMPPLSLIAKDFRVFAMGILGASALSLVCIHWSYVNLLQEDIFTSSLFIWGAELNRLVPVILGIIIFRKMKASFKMKGVLAVFVLLSIWLITPPLTISLLQLPSSIAATDAPEGKERLGYSQPSIDPFSPHFSKDLDDQDTHILHGREWWCSDKPKSYQTPRVSVALRLSKTTKLMDIKEQIHEIAARGITQIGIVGQHNNSKTLPPLKQHTKNPTITWFIDPPPKTSRKGILKGEKIVWKNTRFHMACQIWMPWETSVDVLYHVGEDLITKCSSLYLILSEPKKNWVPPVPCSQNTPK